ncbi:MAG TPA: cation/H(+) antiporter [Desulfotomaculum sp.]|nr:cation/H(+) antiporter [Desulfotomaculum sp.]
MTSDVVLNVGLAFVFISIASWLASRIKFSSIPFLILFGMLVGPNAPEIQNFSLKLISHTESIELLARLGVLLLLFYLGLEFSVGKLVETGKILFKGGISYVALNFLRGLGFGWIFFNTWTEAMIFAGITGISSSAIITKLLVDLKRAANPETELILGIMVFEDVFMAMYLSILSGMVLAGGLSTGQVFLRIAIIFIFIISVIALGRRFGKLIERRLNTGSADFFSIAIFTMLLLAGILAEEIYLAEAIGALMLGLVLAETVHNHRIIQMITPMRDLFGAFFFFSFGMTIDYNTFGEVVVIAAAAVLMTVIGNIVTGLIASWLAGYKKRRAANVAFTIIARGEFSLIVASFAAAAGLNKQLAAFAALYVLALAFISPALAKNTKFFYEYYEKVKNSFKRPQNHTLPGG